MAGPSGYVRECREKAANRRLEIAQMLRADSTLTNIALASKLGKSRNTIAGDRQVIMKQLIDDTKSETELLRAELLAKLDGLVADVEKHRKKDGKLSLGAIDQVLSITKCVMELTGCRKPVVEKKLIRHTPIQFETFIGNPPKTIKAEFITEPAKLMGGSDEQP